MLEDLRDRQQRAANNQTLFREVNERIKDVNTSFQIYTELSDWVCECANDTCAQRLELAVKDYEHVRSAGERFFVAPGDEHVWPDAELVVERHEKYWVVEKIELAGKLAKEANPRGDDNRLEVRK